MKLSRSYNVCFSINTECQRLVDNFQHTNGSQTKRHFSCVFGCSSCNVAYSFYQSDASSLLVVGFCLRLFGQTAIMDKYEVIYIADICRYLHCFTVIHWNDVIRVLFLHVSLW